jgi:hypothetical protein
MLWMCGSSLRSSSFFLTTVGILFFAGVFSLHEKQVIGPMVNDVYFAVLENVFTDNPIDTVRSVCACFVLFLYLRVCVCVCVCVVSYLMV